MKTNKLVLGYCDPGKMPSNPIEILNRYHTDGRGEVFKNERRFRDDDNSRFVDWEEGENVQFLQEFLYNAGFMTKKYNEGIFDYVTEAAVRLFQEYVRTIDPGDKTFKRDGQVGPKTWGKIEAWPPGKKCEWHASRATENPTHDEYNNWFKILVAAQQHYSKPENQGPIMKAVNAMADTKSTIKVSEWTFEKDKIHLIGIRRNESNKTINNIRTNDDLFVLLLNGMVFKFWGSTDPRTKKHRNGKLDEGFLVEGQHRYRFGWHKLGLDNGKYHTYRALRPVDEEKVVVIRDWVDDNILTIDDMIKNGGLGFGTYINIHWSGKNRSSDTTWSDGCQVIRGQSYINNRKQPIDLSNFTANNYDELYANDHLDKGAYNMLADLVVCYSNPNLDGKKPDRNQLLYTLGNEKETLPMIKTMFGENYVMDALNAMNADGANL